MNTYIVIPFKDEPEMTIRVVNQLIGEKVKFNSIYRLLLMDNGSRPESVEEVRVVTDEHDWIEIRSCPGLGIYQMWNRGIEIANADLGDRFNIGFFNNDITLATRTVDIMASTLRSHDEVGCVYPDYDAHFSSYSPTSGSWWLKPTAGTYKDGGMCGWCFMVRGELWREGTLPLVDENLKWWFGDDFIELKVREAGYSVCRITKLPLLHLNEATASNGENNWTHEQKGRDIAYWNATYA